MSAARSKSTSSQVRPALPPTFGKDNFGHFISVVCGNLNGQRYVGKLDVSKRSVGKCVLSSGKWCTPPEFEVLGGKKARKWKQSLMHLGKPLCDYDLGLSPDNISSLPSVSDTSTATAVPLFTASDIPSAGVVGTLFATSNRSSVSACNSVVTDVHDCPLLANAVLSFIKAFRLKGDNESLKGIVIERFSDVAVDTAKKLLWDVCKDQLVSAGLSFHSRRDSDKRSQLVANLEDILQAFQSLDSLNQVPSIYCEAVDLLQLPPLSLDPVAEQVKSNSLALKTLTSTIEDLSKKLTSLGSTLKQPVASSFASVVSSGSPSDALSSSVVGPPASVCARQHKESAALLSRQSSGRELNLILFGLEETSSIVETKQSVDEILAFIAGKPVSIKDMFRLGSRPSSSSASTHARPRPVLLKLSTAWDRRVVLFSKRKLKDFRIQHLFLREDLPPDHKVRQWKLRSSALQTQSASGGHGSTISDPSSSTIAHSSNVLESALSTSQNNSAIGTGSSSADPSFLGDASLPANTESSDSLLPSQSASLAMPDSDSRQFLSVSLSSSHADPSSLAGQDNHLSGHGD